MRAQTATAASLPALPHGWPKTLQLGLTDAPGGARALRARAVRLPLPVPRRRRQHRLGLDDLEPGRLVRLALRARVAAAHEIPVFTYYQLLQSKPGGGDEAHADLANLRNPDTMQAYWADVETFFRRAKGAKPVVLHVEPDLWGYIEQASSDDDAASVPAVVPDGLPQNAAGFAQEFVRMRDRLAPNVILAWHMSGWGTKHDIAIEDPPDRTVVGYATRSAAFYRSLGAAFDLSFEDFSDRDAAFYEKVEQRLDGLVHRRPTSTATCSTDARSCASPASAWPPGRSRSATRGCAMDNTTGHYQDNRVQWLLDGASGRAHLRAYVQAGYVGLPVRRRRGRDDLRLRRGRRTASRTRRRSAANTRPSLSADDDGGSSARSRGPTAAGSRCRPRATA